MHGSILSGIGLANGGVHASGTEFCCCKIASGGPHSMPLAATLIVQEARHQARKSESYGSGGEMGWERSEVRSRKGGGPGSAAFPHPDILGPFCHCYTPLMYACF